MGLDTFVESNPAHTSEAGASAAGRVLRAIRVRAMRARCSEEMGRGGRKRRDKRRRGRKEGGQMDPAVQEQGQMTRRGGELVGEGGGRGRLDSRYGSQRLIRACQESGEKVFGSDQVSRGVRPGVRDAAMVVQTSADRVWPGAGADRDRVQCEWRQTRQERGVRMTSLDGRG